MTRPMPLTREQATELHDHLIAVHNLYKLAVETSLLQAPYDYMDWRCALVDINNYIRRIDNPNLGEPDTIE